MEVLLPFVTALIIDEGLQKSNINNVLRYGVLMIVMAALSLLFGALAGRFAARADVYKRQAGNWPTNAPG